MEISTKKQYLNFLQQQIKEKNDLKKEEISNSKKYKDSEIYNKKFDSINKINSNVLWLPLLIPNNVSKSNLFNINSIIDKNIINKDAETNNKLELNNNTKSIRSEFTNNLTTYDGLKLSNYYEEDNKIKYNKKKLYYDELQAQIENRKIDKLNNKKKENEEDKKREDYFYNSL